MKVCYILAYCEIPFNFKRFSPSQKSTFSRKKSQKWFSVKKSLKWSKQTFTNFFVVKINIFLKKFAKMNLTNFHEFFRRKNFCKKSLKWSKQILTNFFVIKVDIFRKKSSKWSKQNFKNFVKNKFCNILFWLKNEWDIFRLFTNTVQSKLFGVFL